MVEITVFVCARNAVRTLEGCLKALWDELAPYELVKLWVINHDSTDGTDRILEEWKLRTEGALQVSHYEGGALPDVRNFAVSQAEGRWIAFVDSDCIVQPGWISAVMRAIQRVEEAGQRSDWSRVAVLGGANFPAIHGGTPTQALGLALGSMIVGGGTPQNKPVSDTRFLKHIPSMNAVYRLDALRGIGGFDPQFREAGEDVDVSFRLREAGYLLLSEPGFQSVHNQSPELSAWFRKMIRYGSARAQIFLNHSASLEPKYLAPLALWCALLAGTVFVHLAVPLIYLFALAIGLLPQAIRTRASIPCWLLSVVFAFLTHFGYALGMVKKPFELILSQSVEKASGAEA